MDFRYIIENNGITITGYKNKTITNIEIPNKIGDYPVSKIRDIDIDFNSLVIKIDIPKSVNDIESCALLSFNTELKYINNLEVTDGVNIINDKFVYYNSVIYKITYKICDDYYCKYDDELRYFTNNELFYGNFRR